MKSRYTVCGNSMAARLDEGGAIILDALAFAYYKATVLQSVASVTMFPKGAAWRLAVGQSDGRY
jgi:hypothetical protein